MSFRIEIIKIVIIILISLLGLIFISCNPPIPVNIIRFDFLQNFDKADKTPGKIFRYQSWEKGTEGRDAMMVGVYGEASFKLLPEQTGKDLYFGLRLRKPPSAHAVAIIAVETISRIDTVFRRSMDAAQNINDRNWSDEYVNMSHYLNQAITVRFSVQYRDTDAWVEWSSPILVAEKK